jgi:glycogen operon protein
MNAIIKPQKLTLTDGNPKLLGARFGTMGRRGINFAVFSTHEQVELELYRNQWEDDPTHQMVMNRTPWRDVFGDDVDGWIHHCFVRGLGNRTLYDFRVDGAVKALDPYALAHTGKPVWAEDSSQIYLPKCVAYHSNYRWRNALPVGPIDEEIIYEVLVAGYTGHHTAKANGLKGSLRGMARKIAHMLELGITVAELMPIMEADPNDAELIDPETGIPLENLWGYNPINFFAVDSNLSSSGRMGDQIDECKWLVDTLNGVGIRVILDRVFNHTREGNEKGPVLNFKALADGVYYLKTGEGLGFYHNYSGVGNTLNTNHPVTRRMILDAMRYGREELHVSGERMDLAGVFLVERDAQVKSYKTPVMAAIEEDPFVQELWKIAEPWAATFNEQRFKDLFSGWIRWDDTIRDDLRKWSKGDSTARTLAAALSLRGFVVFTTCHDGFRLIDLTMYNEKHNFRNGMRNTDGVRDNHSWNHGFEGELDDCKLPEVEKQQIHRARRTTFKNLVTLLCSCLSTIMITSGDEFGQSARGNNNYVYQYALNMLDWSLKNKNRDLFRFWKMMIAIRKKYFRSKQELAWQSVKRGGTTNGDETYWTGRFLGFLRVGVADLPLTYEAFNSHWEDVNIELPLPPEGKQWHVLVDTYEETGKDIFEEVDAPVVNGNAYKVRPRSSIVLIAK